MHDIIAIGDTTEDVFLAIDEDEAKVLCELDTQKCQICFNYADKLPVRKFARVLAVGNAANLAIGASRLGLKSAIYTILGNDQEAKEMFKVFKQEGVATKYIQFDKEQGSNFSAVINYKGERTILVFHQRRHYHLPKFTKTKWIYYTSIGAGHEALHHQLPELIKSSGAKLGFNPGTYQLKEGLEALKPILAATEVLLLNLEEAQRLVGESSEIKELLRRLRETGVKIAVITDGPAGSYCYDGRNFYFQKIFEVPAIERTGAGDSYSAGFLSALIHGRDVKEAMRWGTMNAAFVIQKIGAREGLLRKDEMERLLRENTEFKPALL